MFLKKSKKTFESCGPAIQALRGISFGYIPVTHHQLAWKLDREVLWLRIGGMKQGSILYLHCHKAFLCMTCMLFPAHSEWNEHSYDKKYNWTTLLFLQLLTLTQKTNTKHNTTHLKKQHMNDLLQFQGAKYSMIYNATQQLVCSRGCLKYSPLQPWRHSQAQQWLLHTLSFFSCWTRR